MLKLYCRNCGDEHELSAKMYQILKNISQNKRTEPLKIETVIKMMGIIEKAEKEGIQIDET